MSKRKDQAAVSLGRRGGKARLKTMTPEERSEIAREAAKARWGTPMICPLCHNNDALRFRSELDVGQVPDYYLIRCEHCGDYDAEGSVTGSELKVGARVYAQEKIAALRRKGQRPVVNCKDNGLVVTARESRDRKKR